MIDIKEIFHLLPHRYPFLLVDRVVDLVEGKSIHAYKNITFNEPQFTGHFPDEPIFPGVMVIESMAQATGILAFKTSGKKPDDDNLYLLVGVDRTRFKRPVVPGDRLELFAEVITVRRNIWKFNCVAKVDGFEVASAEIMCAESKKK